MERIENSDLNKSLYKSTEENPSGDSEETGKTISQIRELVIEGTPSSSSMLAGSSSGAEGAVLGKVSLEEVFGYSMWGVSELQRVVGSMIPLDRVVKIERIAENTYEITFKDPLRGEVNWGDNGAEFTKEAKVLLKALLKSFEVQMQKAPESPEEEKDGWIKGVLEKVGLTPSKLFCYGYLTEAWKGLDESHWRLDETIKVQIEGERCTILDDGLRFSLHAKDVGQVLYNVLPMAAYAIVAPILAKNGMFKATWRGYKTQKPTQLTYSITGISKGGVGGYLHLMPNTKEPNPFKHESWQEPVTWETSEIGNQPPTEGSMELIDEEFAFVGKYLQWS